MRLSIISGSRPLLQRHPTLTCPRECGRTQATGRKPTYNLHEQGRAEARIAKARQSRPDTYV